MTISRSSSRVRRLDSGVLSAARQAIFRSALADASAAATGSRGRARSPVSEQTVDRLLHALAHSLQANRTTPDGRQHPNRDAQLLHINQTVAGCVPFPLLPLHQASASRPSDRRSPLVPGPLPDVRHCWPSLVQFRGNHRSE